MKFWVISDLHLGHANIIRYTGRPFLRPGDLTPNGYWTNKEITIARTSEMDAKIIKNWNERVKPGDTVIHIGDFCFRNSPGGKVGEGTVNRAEFYKSQLNGNIVFVKGNHDKNNGLDTKIEGLMFRYGKQKYYCVHKPQHYNPVYKVNLVGHIHEKWGIKQMDDGTLLVNMSVEQWDYRPVSVEEIEKRINKYKRENKIGRLTLWDRIWRIIKVIAFTITRHNTFDKRPVINTLLGLIRGH